MEKKKKFTTVCISHLASFEGFYCSIWSPDDEVYGYSVEEGAEEDKDFTVDYEGYQNAVVNVTLVLYTESEKHETYTQEFFR